MTRSLRIEKVPSTTLVCIKWNGGGEVPATLSGTYTSVALAQKAIDIWKATNDRDVEIESPPVDEEAARMEARKRGRPPMNK